MGRKPKDFREPQLEADIPATVSPISQPTDENKVNKSEETLLQEILKAAQDTSVLNGKELVQKIDHILSLRLENELMITNLLKVGVQHDQLGVVTAAQINNKSKDSISELVKVKQLLEGSATERLDVMSEQERSELNLLRGGLGYGRG